MAGRSVPDKEFLDDIRRVAKKLKKRAITTTDMSVHGKYCPSVANKRFGSWAGALLKAGVIDTLEESYAHSTKENRDRNVERRKSAEHEKTIETLQRKLDAVKDIEALRVDTHVIKAAKSKGHEATAIAIASDWHVGEHVDPKKLRVPGGVINAYDNAEARKRADEFWAKILLLVEIERAAVKVPRLILGLLGDFITGYIHPELEESNLLSPLEEVEFAQELICSGIELLRKHGKFEEIVIPCVYGNHGRTTFKSRISTGAENSYEWFLYRQIARYYEKDRKLKFIVGDGIHTYIETYGVRLRFSHGDQIRFGGGVGGLTIPLNKAVDSWNSSSLQRADYDFMGHWHQLHNHGKVIVNGSLIGYSPYSLAIKARYERPQQAFCMLDGKYKCISSFRPIWVTDK